MTNLTNMFGPDVIETAKKLSEQGENGVLSIVFLIVLASAFALVLKGVATHFVKQYETLLEDHKQAREAYHASLESLVADYHALTRESGVNISKNTDALNRNTEALTVFVASKK